MGQCTSNKTKGNLSVKKILSHKKPIKMDKHKQFKEPNNDLRPMQPGRKENNRLLDPPHKKPAQTKGVAMSFGFKRRPTPMTTTSSTLAWEDISDPNGNKEDSSTMESRNSHANKDRTSTHRTTSSSSQRSTINTITQTRPPRFSSPQVITNKVADMKFAPHQTQYGSAPNTYPTNGMFTRNAVVTKTQVIEAERVGKEDYEQPVANAQGKFTFQTTRLPQPEAIRVVETKTAKTIANNNRRSARIWRQYEQASLKIGHSTEESACGSNNRRFEDAAVLERLQGSNRFSSMENSDSCSDTCTPPPLPELPSVFTHEKQEKEMRNVKGDHQSFLKSTSPSTFLKTRGLNRECSQSSIEQDWINGGEAMADDVSLMLSPKCIDSNKQTPRKTSLTKSGGMAEVVLQSLLVPSTSLEMIDSLKDSMHLTLSDEDPNFTAVAANNNLTGALLDDEILSPVESLLSSSETEELMKKKMTRSSSNSKDVNEKPTPSSPDSPSHATYSLSLSDDKDDFLIDDEIADQPELLFEEVNNAVGRVSAEKTDGISLSSMKMSYTSDYSPLPLRKNKREFLGSVKQGSFESLSPCESITSEDLMMDYDISQANETSAWDRQSGSYNSLEATPKARFKSAEIPFNNKHFFKNSSTPKNSLTNGLVGSPNSFRGSLRSSPECRSPKRTFTYQDQMSESLVITKANHSAVQQDIIGIKTMLLTLKRVLNESETSSLIDATQQNNTNNNNDGEFRLELADLKRQVLFLQGQLEDKEQIVCNLQKQISDLTIQSTKTYLDNDQSVLSEDVQERCNAATQTERTRPLSTTGIFSLNTSPVDDNDPILRFMVK